MKKKIAFMLLFAVLPAFSAQASEVTDRWNQAREEEITAKQAKIDDLKTRIDVLTRQVEDERKTASASQEKIWKEYKAGLETERGGLQDQIRALESREQLFEAELRKRKEQDELRIQEKTDHIGKMMSEIDFLSKQIEEDRKNYERQYAALKEAETNNLKAGQSAPAGGGDSIELQNGSMNLSPSSGDVTRRLQSTEGYEYYLEIGDVLEIEVWRVPDLTSEVTVRPDGRISLPIVGDITVAGMTLTQLRDILAKKFSDYVWNPQVSIAISQFGGRKFVVLGEVRGPGVYRFQQDISLIEALALAGGFSDRAKMGRVMIIRGDIRKSPQVKIINANMNNLLKKGMLSENLNIKPNDIIYVTKDFLTDYKDVIDNLISPTLNTGTDFLVFRSAVRTAQDRRN